MTFDADTIRAIQFAAKTVAEHTRYQADKVDSSDNPELVACEVIDLVEWCSPSLECQSAVAKLVLDGWAWPNGARLPICRHFNLPY